MGVSEVNHHEDQGTFQLDEDTRDQPKVHQAILPKDPRRDRVVLQRGVIH